MIPNLSAKYPDYLFMPYMNITPNCIVSNIMSWICF